MLDTGYLETNVTYFVFFVRCHVKRQVGEQINKMKNASSEEFVSRLVNIAIAV
jgi:hypothetical protein